MLRKLIVLGIALAATLVALPLQAQITCLDAPSLAPGETHRNWSDDQSERLHRLAVPGEGSLLVELIVPVGTIDRPELFTAPACGGASTARTATRSAADAVTPTSRVLTLVGGGESTLAVASPSPGTPLGDYRLETRFVASRPEGGSVSLGLDGDGTGGTGSGGSGGTGGTGGSGSGSGGGGTGGGGGGDDGTGTSAPGVERPRAEGGGRGPTLCGQPADDHPDGFLCADVVALGWPVDAVLANDHGDDVDSFVFHVTEPSVVTIESRGGVDTIGELLDSAGTVVAWTADGGEDDNFRLVRRLRPGRWVVRVGGEVGSEGAYRLVVTAD